MPDLIIHTLPTVNSQSLVKVHHLSNYSLLPLRKDFLGFSLAPLIAGDSCHLLGTSHGSEPFFGSPGDI